MIAIFGLACIVPSMLLWGWVLQKNWGWFLEPQFGLETPSIAMCLGISTLIRGLTYQHREEPETMDSPMERILKVTILAFLLPLMWLLMGWIISAFV